MDIAILLVLTVIIFYTFRNQLGKISEEEKDRISQNLKNYTSCAKPQGFNSGAGVAKINDPKVIEGEIVKIISVQKNIPDDENLKNLDKDLAEKLYNIFIKINRDSNDFIEIVRNRFESTLKAFCKEDLKQLQAFLSDKIFEGFKNAINQRNAQKNKLHTDIISFVKTNFISAEIVGGVAFVGIEFVTKQINFITDEGGKIVEGSKDSINEIKDVWRFEKNLDSVIEDWKIISTA